jgi:hypothetical protein
VFLHNGFANRVPVFITLHSLRQAHAARCKVIAFRFRRVLSSRCILFSSSFESLFKTYPSSSRFPPPTTIEWYKGVSTEYLPTFAQLCIQVCPAIQIASLNPIIVPSNSLRYFRLFVSSSIKDLVHTYISRVEGYSRQRGREVSCLWLVAAKWFTYVKFCLLILKEIPGTAKNRICEFFNLIFT